MLKGHKKAVSYVKFLNNEDLVSASTDSQLKLWNIKQPNYVRSFEGKYFSMKLLEGTFYNSQNNTYFQTFYPLFIHIAPVFTVTLHLVS